MNPGVTMKKIILSIALVCISFQYLNAQSNVPSFVKDSMDTYIQRGLERWDIPGVAVCIVKDGKLVLAKGYGVKEVGKNDNVDENTLFMIGSNTKAFTGTILAMLEHEGKCKLSDKVQKWLPDFKMNDPWVAKEINLVDIVSHRMGFETFQGDFMYWTSDLSDDGVLERFGKLKPLYGFREKYGYTNAGYAVAGKVIEKISGLTWNDYLKTKILKPLKMDRTVPLSADINSISNVALPHTVVDGKTVSVPFPLIDNMAPCGSISSSVLDMSHWLIAQLDSGKFEGENIIPYSVISQTRKPSTIVGRTRHPFNQAHYNLYALGWGLQDYENREIVSHTGGVNGFVTSVTLIPSENLGIVVLTNTEQNLFFISLRWEILDSYLGLPYRDYDSFYFDRSKTANTEEEAKLQALRDSVRLNLKSSLPLSDYCGRYENEVYGYLDIIEKENYLEIRLEHHSKLIGKLEPLGGNRFLSSYNDPIFGSKPLEFNVTGGKVKSLDFSVHEFIEYTGYNFIKK